MEIRLIMPKNKPDKTIEYRISLQDKEREILEQLSTAYTVNRIGTPLVALLSDGSAMILVTAFFYTLFGKGPDMEQADPLLYKAITGPPTDYFENFSLWYAWKRKKVIEEKKLTSEQLEAAENILLESLPGIGPIFGFFQ